MKVKQFIAQNKEDKNVMAIVNGDRGLYEKLIAGVKEDICILKKHKQTTFHFADMFNKYSTAEYVRQMSGMFNDYLEREVDTQYGYKEYMAKLDRVGA